METIRVKDKKMSLEHALFYRDKKGYVFVKDLGSKNGVDLNGTLVGDARILVGDTIKLGETLIEIEKESLSFIEKVILGIRTIVPRREITFIK